LHQRSVDNGFDGQFTRFLQTLQHDFPELTVLDARSAHYDDKVFRDPHHLGRDGAIGLSTDLADVLAQHHTSPAPAWVSLPSYQPREENFPLEDFMQARIVLRDQWVRGQKRARK